MRNIVGIFICAASFAICLSALSKILIIEGFGNSFGGCIWPLIAGLLSSVFAFAFLPKNLALVMLFLLPSMSVFISIAVYGRYDAFGIHSYIVPTISNILFSPAMASIISSAFVGYAFYQKH